MWREEYILGIYFCEVIEDNLDIRCNFSISNHACGGVYFIAGVAATLPTRLMSRIVKGAADDLHVVDHAGNVDFLLA